MELPPEADEGNKMCAGRMKSGGADDPPCCCRVIRTVGIIPSECTIGTPGPAFSVPRLTLPLAVRCIAPSFWTVLSYHFRRFGFFHVGTMKAGWAAELGSGGFEEVVSSIDGFLTLERLTDGNTDSERVRGMESLFHGIGWNGQDEASSTSSHVSSVKLSISPRDRMKKIRNFANVILRVQPAVFMVSLTISCS